MARLLLDENMPRRLARVLPGHEVSTVRGQQWTGLKNGALLARAEDSFDVFVTMDTNIPFQQSVQGLRIGVLLIRAWSNRFAALEPHVDQIAATAARVTPGSVVEMDLKSG